MPINQPYDPRYNAKLYIPKLTEEERRARATPLENLKGLRFRSQVPAAPVEVPTPAESVPPAPAPQDTAAPEKVPVSAPAPVCTPTILEVVQAEFPEIFKQEKSRATLDAHEVEHCPVSAFCSADGHGWERAQRTEATVAKAPDPPSDLAYEEDDILAYANVVSFYERPRRNTTPPKATLQRSSGLRSSAFLIPHHSSG